MAGLGFYRAFEIGKMAVVAPLSASYPVITVALSLLAGVAIGGFAVQGLHAEGLQHAFVDEPARRLLG